MQIRIAYCDAGIGARIPSDSPPSTASTNDLILMKTGGCGGTSRESGSEGNDDPIGDLADLVNCMTSTEPCETWSARPTTSVAQLGRRL